MEIQMDLSDDLLHMVTLLLYFHVKFFLQHLNGVCCLSWFDIACLYHCRYFLSLAMQTFAGLQWCASSGELPVLMKIFGDLWILKTGIYLQHNVSYFYSERMHDNISTLSVC